MLSAGRAGLLFLPVPLLLALNVDLSAEVWLLLIAASGALASIIPTVRHLPTARIRFGLLRAMLKKHWIYAQWLILMVGVAMAQEQFVWIWVGALEGDKAVGGMRAGQYLLGLTHVIMMGMHNFVAVEAAKAYTAGGHGSLTRYLAQQTIVLGALVGGIILMLALFAETWMRLVFGEEFVPFASTMRWFCLIYTVVFVREVWVMYLRTMEATRAIFVAFAFSSLFALIGTYPAIKLGGIGGALGVILIAHTISLVLIMMAIAAARR